MEPPNHTMLYRTTTHTTIVELSHITTLHTPPQKAPPPIAHTNLEAVKTVPNNLSLSSNMRIISLAPSNSEWMAKQATVERWELSAKAMVNMETVLIHGREKLHAALQSS